jgi:4-hydroxybenzoate polyprenyltransferase
MNVFTYIYRGFSKPFAYIYRGLRNWFNELNVLTYIYRGLKYALTSAAAIFAGYLMQAEHIVKADILMLSIPVAGAWFFFICYANRFDLERAEGEHGLQIQQLLEKTAVIVFLIFLAGWITIALLAVALLLSTSAKEIPTKLLVAVGIYVFLFVYYGIFLLRYRTDAPLPLIRHMLIWPVVLSIGVGLYCGLSFAVLANSYIPLAPIGLIVGFYAGSSLLGLGRNSFLWVMLTSILLFTTLLVLNLFGILPIPSPFAEFLSPFAAHLSLMFFCIAASAYLAVFEAWKITAYVATIEGKLKARKPDAISQSEAMLKDDRVVRNKEAVLKGKRRTGALHLRTSSEYALATLAALTITILVLPLYFVFSDYGNVFLIVFAIHALVAFVYWFYWGRGKHLKRSWDRSKIFFGLVFLGILVLSTYKKNVVPYRFLGGFADWTAFFTFAVLTGSTIPGLITDIIQQKGTTVRAFLLGLFRNRVNFTRLLALLCVIPLLVTVSLSKTIDAPLPKHYRAELAFYVYALCILFCLIVELVYFINRGRRIRKMRRAITRIAGFLLIIRIATSTVIGLVIILPSLHEGVSLARGILTALPFFLAAAGGFALNDYYDIEKDVLNKPYRAIPSGKMSERAVLITAVILIGGAISAASLVSSSKFQLTLYYLSILGVCFYNYLVKHFTLSKNVVTSMVSTLPILYVVFFLKYPATYLLIPAASLVFLMGREWLMDIRDMKGDAHSGIRTLPIRIGQEKTARMAFISFFASAALLLPLVARIQTKWSVSFLCLMTVSIVLLSVLWNFRRGAYRRWVVLGLWFPMDCGILMLFK